MKILYFAKAYPPETGGIETYSEQVAMAYDRAGHEVTVITAHPGETGTEMRGNIAIHNVGQGPQAKVFVRMMKKLRSLRGQEFDFVHSTSWRVGLPPLLLRPKLPLVVTVHGREVFVVPGPLRPAMTFVLKRARLLPTVSQAILDKFQETVPYILDNAFADWNGISFEEETRSPPDKPEGDINIFCMCRMVERKNVAGAIIAVARLIREGRSLTFNIAGSGPQLEELRSLVRSECMEQHIHVLGRVTDEDVAPLYRKSHIFLHPQVATTSGGDLEGFGLTIADGMAFGAVAIAGRSGGPQDFVTPGETGYLVDGEDISDICEKLRLVIDDSAHMAQLSRNGWAFATGSLTWDIHAEKIMQRMRDA